jgi:hypothetical protein
LFEDAADEKKEITQNEDENWCGGLGKANFGGLKNFKEKEFFERLINERLLYTTMQKLRSENLSVDTAF